MSHLYEWERADPRNPTATLLAEKMHYDSMGIFIVGPFDVANTKLLSPEDRVSWGAMHPIHERHQQGELQARISRQQLQKGTSRPVEAEG